MSKMKDTLISSEEANIFLMNVKSGPLTTTEILDHFVESKRGEQVFASMIECFTNESTGS